MNSIIGNNKIFAQYNDETIRVYQAYGNKIADEVITLGCFGPSFKMERMTWIKPSFLWMMYRSGWGTKEGQNRTFAIDIKRVGFDCMLRDAVLSSFSSKIYDSSEHWRAMLKESEIRCQWDPERDIYGNPQDRRTIQLGLKGNMVGNYVNNWITNISEITETVYDIKEAIKLKKFKSAMLPVEIEYFPLLTGK